MPLSFNEIKEQLAAINKATELYGLASSSVKKQEYIDHINSACSAITADAQTLNQLGIKNINALEKMVAAIYEEYWSAKKPATRNDSTEKKFPYALEALHDSLTQLQQDKVSENSFLSVVKSMVGLKFTKDTEEEQDYKELQTVDGFDPDDEELYAEARKGEYDFPIVAECVEGEHEFDFETGKCVHCDVEAEQLDGGQKRSM